jgi:phage/plasmid primase-like uncharacterized protein
VKSHGLKLYRGEFVIAGMPCDGALLIPIRDSEGGLHSLEFISPEGEKRFLPGGKKIGGFFLIGTLGAALGIAEGYSTAASLHEAINHAIAVAFDCGNLPVVAKALGEKYPSSSLIICGDRGQGEAQARKRPGPSMPGLPFPTSQDSMPLRRLRTSMTYTNWGGWRPCDGASRRRN